MRSSRNPGVGKTSRKIRNFLARIRFLRSARARRLAEAFHGHRSARPQFPEVLPRGRGDIGESSGSPVGKNGEHDDGARVRDDFARCAYAAGLDDSCAGKDGPDRRQDWRTGYKASLSLGAMSHRAQRRTRTREVITHPGSVVVLPVFPDGRILMIRQYRHAARQYLWELVAGGSMPVKSLGKPPRAKLIEETGYRARKFRIFLDVFPTPGFLEERMFILLAEGLTAESPNPRRMRKCFPAPITPSN